MTRFVFAALVAFALTACGPQQPSPQSAFDGRLDDWTRSILADSPELATTAGVSEDIAGRGFNARLDDRSTAGAERRRTAALRRLVELRVLDPSTLTDEERVTYDTLRVQFQAAADGANFTFGEFGPLGGIAPYTINQLDAAFLTLPDFLDARHAIANFADAEAYLARLRAVPAAIDGESERARADALAGVVPPDFIIDRALESLQTLIDTPPAAQLYVTSFRDKLARLAPPPAAGQTPSANYQRAQNMLAQAETIVRERIAPAHLRAAAMLRSLRQRATHEAGVSRLPNGAAYYRAALRIETTTDLTPGQIHVIGRERVRELTQELDIALRRMGHAQGSVGERLAQMTADPQYQYANSDEGRAQLIADVQRRVANVMRLAPRWFGQLPTSRLEVRRVPPFAEAGAPGAYYEGPAIDGSAPGIYYLNLRNLAELTRIDLPTQDYHEAVPGHHFQTALARERDDTPLLRRLMGFNAYSEGWGLYAEQLADEQGLYESDPVGRIGYLRWQLWRAARLVVDTGLHAGHWSREQAIDYLRRTTGDTEGVIVSEVERYVVWPGQACSYELGRREIAADRDLARNRLGASFQLRSFHDMVLREGETPLSVLTARTRRWIAAQ